MDLHSTPCDDQRPTVRLAFTGFPGPFNPSQISNLLQQRFQIVLDQLNPEYVICSVFTQDYLRYTNAVRIFFTGENVSPDFNLCDYAFGYDRIQFGDRYMRLPNYQLYDHFKDISQRRRSDISGDPSTRQFCNFIYTNGSAHPFRDQFFHALSKYKRITSAGAHLRNSDDSIGTAYNGDWWTPKVNYQRHFKFSVAFENTSFPGYTTEKIVHALAADTIPIYWGNPEIGREFNTQRFVNCHDFPDLESIIERVQMIDRDDHLYRNILAEPFFPNNEVPEELQDQFVLSRFAEIFAQPHHSAFRRSRHAWGLRYEQRRIKEVRAYQLLSSNGLRGKLMRTFARVVDRR